MADAVEINCTSGEVTISPQSLEEATELAARAAAHAQDQAAQQARLDGALANLRAAAENDVNTAALLALLGLS